MKRNFLILMLLSLLPLAGWAQGVSMSDFEFLITSGQNYYYTGSTPAITVSVKNTSVSPEVTLTTADYDLQYYKDGEAVTASNVKDVGTYSVVAKAKSNSTTYSGQTAAIEFNIQKRPLVITGTPGSKTFGTVDDGTIFTVGTAANSVKTKTVTGESGYTPRDVTSTFAGKITFNREDGTNAKQYPISATITDENLNKNYSIAKADITTNGSTQAKYTIDSKEIIADGTNPTVTITIDDASLFYNGKDQKPTITIHDIALNKDLTLKNGSNGDYDVAYPTSYANASTYNITISGMKNYKTTEIISKTFTISQAPVLVTPYAKKTYAGESATPEVAVNTNEYTGQAKKLGDASANFTFQGLKDIEAKDITIGTGGNAPKWESTEAQTAKGAAGTYKLRISNESLAEVFQSTNYTFIAEVGTFEIEKKELQVKANDILNLEYGKAENYTITLSQIVSPASDDVISADETAIRNAIKVTKTTANNVNTLTPSFKTKEEINADSELNDDAKAAAIAVLNNYLLRPTNGTLTYKNATLVISLIEDADAFKGLKKVYDGQDITLPTLAEGTTLRISGRINDTDVVDLSQLKWTATGSKTGNTGKKIADEYDIRLSGATAEHYNISYINSTYTIEQRPIQLTIAKQTFRKGTVPTVAQNYTIETIKDSEGEPLAEQGIASTDKEADVFKLGLDNTKVEQNTTEGDDFGKITTDVTSTDIANGVIAVDAATTPAKSIFANYKFTYTEGSGAVAIIATDTKTLSDNADLTALEATTGSAISVVIDSNRELKKNVWASLVLPFETSARKVSQALGYAVVDMFVEDANSEAMNFKLHMGAIPAYTPFLVKVDETINLNTVVFEDVKIVALTDANRGNLSQSNKNYNFIGNMKYGKVTTGIFYSDGSSMTEDGIKWNKFNGTNSNMRALKAYITAKEGVTTAPVIYIEEPDGSTTAINGVVTEKVSTVKEGWYTLNGVKLDGAPTQKGIYIRNGKKIVVK